MSDTWVKGDWNVICDDCGWKLYASQLRKRWDNLMVCSVCYEVRQPQDFVRASIDNMSVPWSRPEAAPIFIYTQACSTEGRIALADQGTSDCALADSI